MDLKHIRKEELLATIIESVKEKKANDIRLLNFDGIGNAICDYFVICDAESTRQVAAIAECVEDNTKKNLDESVIHAEGYTNSFWVLLDFGNIIVHVFQRPYRHFYKLENLWADAKITHIQ